MLSRIKSIEELELDGRRVLIRADLNCAITEDGHLADDGPILAALPTIAHARQKGGKVIICAHLGRPKGRPRKELSMLAVGERLAELLKTDVFLPDDCIGDGPRKLALNLREGQVMLLENVRFHKGETKNDDAFARGLAALGQVYVNDALGCAHRPHASVVGVPKILTDRAAGKLLIKEVTELARFLAPVQPHTPSHRAIAEETAHKNIPRPFIVAVGGASVSARIGVVEQLLASADAILIGGAMAYTFLAAQELYVGKSHVEEDKIAHARRVLLKAEAKGVDIVLPSDHWAAPSTDEESTPRAFRTGHVPSDLVGVDIGPDTASEFAARIASAGQVLWSGPMGAYEHDAYASGTMQVAYAVARARSSLVIGGDTTLAVRKAGTLPFITHLSTGGGAALEFLEGKELPGIEALRQSRRGTDVA